MAEPGGARGAQSWTAPHEVYADGVLYPAGVRFTTAAPRGAAWVPADTAARLRTER